VDVRRASLAALLLLALAPAAHAQQAQSTDVKVGPVTLQIVTTGDGDTELRDGARVLAKDMIITPALAARFGDTQARVFTISSGGNMCEGWPAVVTVDKAGKVAVDQTMHEECATFSPTADEKGFTFVEAVVPGQNGSVWRFTPEGGLGRLGVLVFRPEPNSTWADLEKKLDHPLSLFYCAPFDAALHKLTGKQYGDLAVRLHVASEVEKKGDYLIGRGCQAHACNTDQGFVAIDRTAHSVFAAMRSDKDVTTWPKAASWPAPLRAELQAWEKAE
jgi:hypothetical protein